MNQLSEAIEAFLDAADRLDRAVDRAARRTEARMDGAGAQAELIRRLREENAALREAVAKAAARRPEAEPVLEPALKAAQEEAPRAAPEAPQASSSHASAPQGAAVEDRREPILSAL